MGDIADKSKYQNGIDILFIMEPLTSPNLTPFLISLMISTIASQKSQAEQHW